MKLRRIAVVAVSVSLAGANLLLAQGTFQNLGFESPFLPLVPDRDGFVVATSAVPHWNVYCGDVQQGSVLINSRSVDTANIALFGPGYPSPAILQGNYSVLLQPGVSPQLAFRVDASISQIGTVPVDSRSLRFLAIGQMAVTFGGQRLSLVPLMGGPNSSTLVGVDVSGIAGQTGELCFIAPDLQFFPNDVLLDDIQFSPVPIPEPSTLALEAFGALLFCAFARRQLTKP